MKNTILFFLSLLTFTCATSQVKISEMSTFSGNGENAYVPVVIDGVNYKIQGKNLAAGKVDSMKIKIASSPDPDTVFEWKGGLRYLVGYIPKPQPGSGTGPVTGTNNFATFPDSQRLVGNTVIDFIDQYSKEYITVTEISQIQFRAVTDDDVDNVLIFKKGSKYYIRSFTGNYKAEWWGIKADCNRGSNLGTDNGPAAQQAVNTVIKFGGGVLEFGVGNYRIDTAVYINDSLQRFITILGAGASYTAGDTLSKGTIFYRTQPGNTFVVNMRQSDGRYYYQSSYTYKGFTVKGVAFIGGSYEQGKSAITMFRSRPNLEDCLAYAFDYLLYQPGTDIANTTTNYCDGGYIRRCRIFNSTLSGIRLYGADGTTLENIITEFGGASQVGFIKVQFSSSISIKGVIMGNKGNGEVQTNSSAIEISDTKGIALEELHMERSYFNHMIYLRNGVYNVLIKNLYSKIECNNLFRFASNVHNVNINGLYTRTNTRSGYYDFNSNSNDITNIKYSNIEITDSLGDLRPLTFNGIFNADTSFKENLRTKERFNNSVAINELLDTANAVKLYTYYERVPQTMTGGGLLTYDTAGYLKWSQRIIIPNIPEEISNTGYMQLLMPSNGTVIEGDGTTSSITVTSDGIPLSGSWDVLYAVHKIGAHGDSITYRIARYTTVNAWQRRPNQFVVAQRNNDNNSLRMPWLGVTLMRGESIDRQNKVPRQYFQESANVNVGFANQTTALVLNRSTNNTANRTIVLPNPLTYIGQDRYIYNYNRGDYVNLVSGTLRRIDTALVTQLDSLSAYHIQSDGTEWKILSRWNLYSGGSGGGDITIDAVPTDGSNNAVSSNGVYDAIAAINPGMANPMSTEGDLIIGGSGGTPGRLVKGSEGQVLKIVSGNVTWGEDSEGEGGEGGTVNSGAANRLAYYPSSGTTVDDLAAITANRALISDANGLPTHSSVTSTQLGYISTLPGNVQDTIAALKSRIAELEENEDITFRYYRPTGSDSIILVFNESDSMSVYAPVPGDGIYNPSFSDQNNVSSILIDSVGYSRNGKSVQVFGGGALSATSGSCTFYMTLPITTNFPESFNHVGGGGHFDNLGDPAPVRIAPVPGTNKVSISFESTNASAGVISFSFGYRVYP